MKHQYLFIVDKDTHTRKATFSVGIHGKNVDILETKARTEYPNDEYIVGGDDYFAEFVSGKIYVDGAFQDAPPYIAPLEDVKIAKIAELKMIRDTKEVEPVAYNGNLFDFDMKSYNRITAAVDVLDQTGTTIMWTTAENTSVEVSAADLHGIIGAAAVRSNELHVKYRTLKQQVEEATTNEAVEAIEWK